MQATTAQLARAQEQVDVDAKSAPHLAGKIVALKLPPISHSIIVVYEDGRELEYIGQPAIDIQLAHG